MQIPVHELCYLQLFCNFGEKIHENQLWLNSLRLCLHRTGLNLIGFCLQGYILDRFPNGPWSLVQQKTNQLQMHHPNFQTILFHFDNLIMTCTNKLIGFKDILKQLIVLLACTYLATQTLDLLCYQPLEIHENCNHWQEYNNEFKISLIGLQYLTILVYI